MKKQYKNKDKEIKL